MQSRVYTLTTLSAQFAKSGATNFTHDHKKKFAPPKIFCFRDYLHQNKHVIFCSCGLRLDTAVCNTWVSHICTVCVCMYTLYSDVQYCMFHCSMMVYHWSTLGDSWTTIHWNTGKDCPHTLSHHLHTLTPSHPPSPPSHPHTLSLSLSHHFCLSPLTHTHTRTHARTHTHTHSSQCRAKSQFSLESVIHTQTIIMSCPVR